MITKDTEKIVETIKKFIEEKSAIGENGLNWKQIAWIDTLDRMTHCLKIAPLSYRQASEEDVAENSYTAECDKCGWWGSSKLLDGGGQIADTGDYGDAYCPVCGNADYISERELILTHTKK